MKKLLTAMLIFASSFALAQCEWLTNETDEFTGVKKQMHKAEKLLGQTSEDMKKYKRLFPEYDYFKIDVSCAKFDNRYAIYFTIKIQTERAYEYYGALREGSKIILKHDSLSLTTLKFAKTETGDSDYTDKTTRYITYCAPDEDAIKALSEKPVVKVRIYWSKGYEDYVVTAPDAILKQLKCF